MNNSHTPLAKFIHWTFTVLYAYGIFKQVEDIEDLNDVSLLNFEIFFAIVFLIIAIMFGVNLPLRIQQMRERNA